MEEQGKFVGHVVETQGEPTGQHTTDGQRLGWRRVPSPRLFEVDPGAQEIHRHDAAGRLGMREHVHERALDMVHIVPRFERGVDVPHVSHIAGDRDGWRGSEMVDPEWRRGAGGLPGPLDERVGGGIEWAVEDQ